MSKSFLRKKKYLKEQSINKMYINVLLTRGRTLNLNQIVNQKKLRENESFLKVIKKVKHLDKNKTKYLFRQRQVNTSIIKS